MKPLSYWESHSRHDTDAYTKEILEFIECEERFCEFEPADDKTSIQSKKGKYKATLMKNKDVHRKMREKNISGIFIHLSCKGGKARIIGEKVYDGEEESEG